MRYLNDSETLKDFHKIKLEHTNFKAILTNVGDILESPAYETKRGLLNTSPQKLEDFQISIASCISPVYS